MKAARRCSLEAVVHTIIVYIYENAAVLTWKPRASKSLKTTIPMLGNS